MIGFTGAVRMAVTNPTSAVVEAFAPVQVGDVTVKLLSDAATGETTNTGVAPGAVQVLQFIVAPSVVLNPLNT